MGRRIGKIGLAALALLTVVGTLTYFYAAEKLKNPFQMAEAKIYLNEKYNPKDRWLPGEQKQKEVCFGNDGKIAAVLRVQFTKTMDDLSNRSGIKELGKEVELNFSGEFFREWEQHGDWYYYKKVLEPGKITDITLQSVTLSNEIGNDEHGIQKNYAGAIFDIQVRGELLQASVADVAAEQQNWKWIPEVTGENVAWREN